MSVAGGTLKPQPDCGPDEAVAIIRRGEYTKGDIVRLLAARSPEGVEVIRSAAETVLLGQVGKAVYYRGLVEFSNECAMNCLYCGIRRGNVDVRRYTLTRGEILDAAQWCADSGYGSIVLQSGERCDPAFVDFVEDVVRAIKENTRSARLSAGLGITLSVGEQAPETYARFLAAGAHRYLLRIETTNPDLFARIHPAGQSLERRMACLRSLRKTGYQVGTGVMIALPGQTLEMLADDVLFFRSFDVDMIGMGPYIPHAQTPMAEWPQPGRTPGDTLQLALLMVSVVRLVMRDINIAATTALQAMDPEGREKGLRHGANVIMPQLTPTDVRKDYLLYDGKPCIDEDRQDCRRCLEARIRSCGRQIAVDDWGDSRHFARRSSVSFPGRFNYKDESPHLNPLPLGVNPRDEPQGERKQIRGRCDIC